MSRMRNTIQAHQTCSIKCLVPSFFFACVTWPLNLTHSCSIERLERELKALGGDLNYGRGSMLHLILTLCHKLEKAFNKIVDGGKDGGCQGGGGK